MSYKRIAAIIAVLTILTSGTLFGIGIKMTIDSLPQSISLEHHTENEIIAKAKELNIDFSTKDAFEESYNISEDGYVAGKLTNDTQQASLNILNLYRYVAGLPYDIQLKEEYIEAAQTGALLNAAVDEMTHHPNKPEGMSDEMYEIGHNACANSNLAQNHGSLPHAMVNGWMDDSNERNIPKMGHRRWVLNPNMQYTGFGSVGAYGTMYASDNTKNIEITNDYVAWPAENTPVEMFSGSVFTFTLNKEYDEPHDTDVKITVTSKTQNKTWHIDNTCELPFYVNNENYCMPKCIIFKVDDFTQPDEIDIHITGITKNGKDAPINHHIHLFSVTELSTPNTTILLQPGHGADFNITAKTLFATEQPQLKWESEDKNITDIYYYPHSEKLGFYGKTKGRTTLKVSATGAEIQFNVIVDESEFYSGDANNDNIVDITDVTAIRKYITQNDIITDYLADVNNDDTVNLLDATLIQQHLVNEKTDTDIGKSRISYFTR